MPRVTCASSKKEGTEEAQSRVENLEEFDTLLQEFEEDFYRSVLVDVPTEQQPKTQDEARKARYPELLPLFIEQSTLASDTERKDAGQGSVLRLMTLHSSKGLEFPSFSWSGWKRGFFLRIRPGRRRPRRTSKKSVGSATSE